MSSQGLPPVLLFSNKKYSLILPQGRLANGFPSQIPVISRKGLNKISPLTMRDAIANSGIKDMELKSYTNLKSTSVETERREKANAKFSKYKFNPGTENGNENIKKEKEEQKYGQLERREKQKFNITIFSESKNALFQDQRAPLNYKRLYLQSEFHC